MGARALPALGPRRAPLREQLERLRRDAGARVLTLPFLAVPALGVDELELLAGVLEERLS